MLQRSEQMSTGSVIDDDYHRAPRRMQQSAFPGQNSPIQTFWSPVPDNRLSGGPAVPRTAARVPDTTGHITLPGCYVLHLSESSRRRDAAAIGSNVACRVMRWARVVCDDSREGPSYESGQQRDGSPRGRDQAVARTAAGTRRSFRAWSCPTSALR